MTMALWSEMGSQRVRRTLCPSPIMITGKIITDKSHLVCSGPQKSWPLPSCISYGSRGHDFCDPLHSRMLTLALDESRFELTWKGLQRALMLASEYSREVIKAANSLTEQLGTILDYLLPTGWPLRGEPGAVTASCGLFALKKQTRIILEKSFQNVMQLAIKILPILAYISATVAKKLAVKWGANWGRSCNLVTALGTRTK